VLSVRDPLASAGHVSPVEGIAAQDDLNEQFARDVERSVCRRGLHSIIVSIVFLCEGKETRLHFMEICRSDLGN
jgi:hypothetical protein